MTNSLWPWDGINSKVYDRQENVDAGAARGWQVILQTEPEKSIAAMKQLGLPVD